MFIDAHCHLNWFDEPEAVVLEAAAAGVKKIPKKKATVVGTKILIKFRYIKPL